VHADPDAVPGFQIRNLLIDIGRTERLIREWIKNNDLQTIELAEAIFEQLPQLHFFETLPLTASDYFFFEGMVSTVRTSLLSVQASIHLEKNKALKELSIELSNLKKNYDNNRLQIKNLELALTDLNESYLRDELDNYKIFDKLNNERLTPFFIKLARVQNTSPDLSKIKGDTGEDLTEDDLGKKITDFYADLYSKPANSITVTEEHINDFLGPVKDLDPVKAAKLSNAEKLDLDSPLNLIEFDKAIKQCNKKSAPGTDGINNRFIYHFWQFFRTPLLRYANCCYEKGTFTSLFKTAKIRLIPKKGNLKRLENWRPISLLNCFYKLISRVLTNRLKKVIDKITQIGQYGYSKKKQCQEVLIGLLTKIHNAKTGGKEGVLVSLDIKKAFDSISHSYMTGVLKFFNFGESFINWVKLLCTNREACVLLLDNKVRKTSN
jgi:hypothetical protein